MVGELLKPGNPGVPPELDPGVDPDEPVPPLLALPALPIVMVAAANEARSPVPRLRTRAPLGAFGACTNSSRSLQFDAAATLPMRAEPIVPKPLPLMSMTPPGATVVGETLFTT